MTVNQGLPDRVIYEWITFSGDEWRIKIVDTIPRLEKHEVDRWLQFETISPILYQAFVHVVYKNESLEEKIVAIMKYQKKWKND